MRGSPARAACLLALVAVAGGLGIAAGQPSLDVAVRAEVVDGGLALTVGGGGTGTTANVLVTHEDPVLGTVVDRVVPISLAAGLQTKVDLWGLRTGTSFNVTLVPKEADLGPLRSALGPVDPERLAALPRLAQLSSPLLPRLGEVPFGMHRIDTTGQVGAGIESYKRAQVRVAPDGEVAGAWCRRDVGDGDWNATGLVVAFSRDGGRTFGERRLITQQALEWPCERWELVDFVDGTAVLVVPRRPTSIYDRNPFDMVRVSKGQPDATRVALQGGLSLWGGHFGAVRADDGRILLAGSAASWRGNDSTLDEVSLWWLGADGEVAPGGALAKGGLLNAPVLLHASKGGVLAVGWTQRAAGPRDVPMFSASLDGGATFSPPAPVPGLEGVIDQATLVALKTDEAGGIHVLVRTTGDGRGATPPGNPEGYRDGHYVRFAADGRDALRHRLTGPDPEALAPQTHSAYSVPALGVAGKRVWISWYDLIDGTSPIEDYRTGKRWWGAVAVESVDRGATFSAPVHLSKAWRLGAAPPTTEVPQIYSVESIEVLRDGRPLLLASGAGNSGLYSVPLFDPHATADAGFVVLREQAVEARGDAPSARANATEGPETEASPGDPTPTEPSVREDGDPPGTRDVPSGAIGCIGALGVAGFLARRRRT